MKSERKLLVTSSYLVLNFRDDCAKEYPGLVFVSVPIEGAFPNQSPEYPTPYSDGYRMSIKS